MKKRHFLLTGGILFIIFVYFFCPLIKVVSFTDEKNPGKKIYSAEALEGFCISYTHSVNKGRVHDYVECLKDGTFIVDKTEFVSYGAGIPEEYEFKNCRFNSAEGTYTITGLDRHFDSILQAVGVVADHSVTIKKSEFFLKDFFTPGTSIRIKIKKVPLGNIVSYENKKKGLLDRYDKENDRRIDRKTGSRH